jgi:hypothetical protein
MLVSLSVEVNAGLRIVRLDRAFTLEITYIGDAPGPLRTSLFPKLERLT